MNQMMDTLLFLPYISEYSYLFPNSSLSNHWERYRSNIESNLKKIRAMPNGNEKTNLLKKNLVNLFE